MASPPETSLPVEAIGGCYVVDPSRPLPRVGGGITAYGVTDRRSGHTGLMGLHVVRHIPPRPRALQVLSSPIEGLLVPLAHGKGPAIGGEPGYFVICPQPPGPALSATQQSWSEASLIELVLRPAANALEQLRIRGVTHRSIRADNVFQPQPGHPVVLGAAWAAPAAMHQPVVYEPPYSAMCVPAGRGDGTVGDDIYALGVLLIVLTVGHVPLAGMDDAAQIRRKLELGSYEALVGEDRLPPGIADLAAGMLAEDPDHRPPLKMLQDLAAARGRKVATRPPHRAQRPLQIGQTTVWNVRMLAYAISSEPVQGLQALTGITLMPWLRRGLGETALAVRIEDVLRSRSDRNHDGDAHSDTLMLMLIVAIIDPLAPLSWNTVVLWPDALGPVIAIAQGRNPTMEADLETLVANEVISSWAAQRPERCDPVALRVEARQYRALTQQRGPAFGLPRLAYTLNPTLPCGSGLMAGHWVGALSDVPGALEAAAAHADRNADPIDIHIAAFIAARSDRRLGMDINALNAKDPGSRTIAQLRLMSELQHRFDPRPLPAVAGWFVVRAAPLTSQWKNRAKRIAVAEQLTSLAAAGQLLPMLALIEDPSGHVADNEAADQATAALARIDAELAAIEQGGGERGAAALRAGQEIAAGIGLAALATVLIVAALG